MKTFDELKGAIEEVLDVADSTLAMDMTPDMFNAFKKLRAAYALHFVEPEDDPDWQEYISPCFPSTKKEQNEN